MAKKFTLAQKIQEAEAKQQAEIEAKKQAESEANRQAKLGTGGDDTWGRWSR